MPDTDRDDLGESYDSFHFFSLKNTYGKNTQELHLLWSWVWTLNTSENGTANYYTLCYWNPRPPTLCWEQRILGVVGENTGESDRPLLWGSRSVGFLIWSREKTSAHGAVQCFQAVCVCETKYQLNMIEMWKSWADCAQASVTLHPGCHAMKTPTSLCDVFGNVCCNYDYDSTFWLASAGHEDVAWSHS